MKVRTNADTPLDAQQAREFGAEGIGLCRTEHMFFEPDRIAAIREMIVSKTVEQREAALAKLLPMQRGDFEGIYEAMEGYPVTIRLLDPPLHEFLPHEHSDVVALARQMNMETSELEAVIDSLHEFNPMMGHRGCRLDVTYPEIGAMQTRAIIEAAINVQKKHPEWNLVPEIMIPLVGEVKELAFVKKIVTDTADAIIAEAGVDLKYLVGTMIEIPRAALTADEIATEAQFFSFGTNDLTQMTFGFSRDDAGKFLDAYYEKKIYENDPFARLDQVGVGKLVETAVEARPADPSRHQARHLWRARRRPVVDRLLPAGRPGLRVLLTVPRPDRPPRRRAVCVGQRLIVDPGPSGPARGPGSASSGAGPFGTARVRYP